MRRFTRLHRALVYALACMTMRPRPLIRFSSCTHRAAATIPLPRHSTTRPQTHGKEICASYGEFESPESQKGIGETGDVLREISRSGALVAA